MVICVSVLHVSFHLMLITAIELDTMIFFFFLIGNLEIREVK